MYKIHPRLKWSSSLVNKSLTISMLPSSIARYNADLFDIKNGLKNMILNVIKIYEKVS